MNVRGVHLNLVVIQLAAEGMRCDKEKGVLDLEGGPFLAAHLLRLGFSNYHCIANKVQVSGSTF